MNHEDYIALQHRLENWTRWARDFGGSIGHCASVEHWYRSPQHWWPEEPHIEPDLHDAIKLERAIRGLPLDYQKPLVLFWVHFRGKRDMSGEIPPEIVYILIRHLAKRYKIGISRHRLGKRIADAQHMVRNRLTY